MSLKYLLRSGQTCGGLIHSQMIVDGYFHVLIPLLHRWWVIHQVFKSVTPFNAAEDSIHCQVAQIRNITANELRSLFSYVVNIVFALIIKWLSNIIFQSMSKKKKQTNLEGNEMYKSAIKILKKLN